MRFLDKESRVNAQGLMGIGHEKLLRRLGWVSGAQVDEVKSAPPFALDL